MATKYSVTKEIFSKRLKELMSDNNETTYSIGEILNLSAATISRYTDGKMAPKITTIYSMATHFNVNPVWLMGYDVEKVFKKQNDKFELSKEEKQLLENYNKLNDLGKKEANKRVAELSYMPMYVDNEISATKDNQDNEEVFIPYTSLDQFEYCNAAHDDDLTDEEKILFDKISLDAINKEELKKFNARKKNK